MGAEFVICFGAQGRPSFDFNSRLILILRLLKDLAFCMWCSFCCKSFKVFTHLFLKIIGELAHALRFLASVVSQSFIAFGDILELHKKFLELSGGINRIFDLEELLQAAQTSKCKFTWKLSASR